MTVQGSLSKDAGDGTADLLFPFRLLWRHWPLVLQFAKRMVRQRYRGTSLGVAWSLASPLILLGAYTFVFGLVFKSRWDIGSLPGPAEFAIALFSGLMVFWLFNEVVAGASDLVAGHTNLVKKSVFPVEVLPFTLVGSALFHMAINLGLLLGALLLLGHGIPATAILFPLVVAPLLVLVLGLAWILSAVGVYLRDVGQVMGLFTTVLMFLAPIFFPMTVVPPAYRDLVMLNPLTLIVEQGRAVLLYGTAPDWGALGLYLVIAWVVAGLGLALFRRLRGGFGDVL